MKSFLYGILIALTIGCSPNVSKQAANIPEPANDPIPKTNADTSLSKCMKFSESPDEEQALNAHVIYRDYLKQKNYAEAFPYWQVAYKLAPAADGKRNTHYADGIKFYEHFLSTETNPSIKNTYIDSIFKFYDEIEYCYGEEGYIAGRKAFDLYYKYKDRATDAERFQLFKKSIDTDGEDCQFFILNPFTDLLVKRFFDEKVELEEAQKYARAILKRLEKGLESGENKPQWEIIADYVPRRIEAFEGVKGFYDCNYYTTKYFKDFEADPANCEIINEVYSRLRWGGCPDDNGMLAQLTEARGKFCVKEPPPPSESRLAYQALREGSYQEAIDKFLEAIEVNDDNEKKASYNLVVSKIYYAHLKNFAQSRKYALQAANFKANWGEPYILIGRLYASSGPLCGPGRGWDSQIVVWPAIDKWQYAKRIDPSVADEANKWIGRYAKYMPSKEDVFQRTLNEGDNFRVGCWIQESTKIRAAK
jgi:tetratricopeptide (TPR) repeat protein